MLKWKGITWSLWWNKALTVITFDFYPNQGFNEKFQISEVANQYLVWPACESYKHRTHRCMGEINLYTMFAGILFQISRNVWDGSLSLLARSVRLNSLFHRTPYVCYGIHFSNGDDSPYCQKISCSSCLVARSIVLHKINPLSITKWIIYFLKTW